MSHWIANRKKHVSFASPSQSEGPKGAFLPSFGVRKSNNALSTSIKGASLGCLSKTFCNAKSLKLFSAQNSRKARSLTERVTLVLNPTWGPASPIGKIMENPFYRQRKSTNTRDANSPAWKERKHKKTNMIKHGKTELIELGTGGVPSWWLVPPFCLHWKITVEASTKRYSTSLDSPSSLPSTPSIHHSSKEPSKTMSRTPERRYNHSWGCETNKAISFCEESKYCYKHLQTNQTNSQINSQVTQIRGSWRTKRLLRWRPLFSSQPRHLSLSATAKACRSKLVGSASSVSMPVQWSKPW